jgi:hypothetical protein
MTGQSLFADIAGWNNSSERTDGLRVVWREGGWTIVAPDGARTIECACCHMPLRTRQAAKLVANAIYPYGNN